MVAIIFRTEGACLNFFIFGEDECYHECWFFWLVITLRNPGFISSNFWVMLDPACPFIFHTVKTFKLKPQISACVCWLIFLVPIWHAVFVTRFLCHDVKMLWNCIDNSEIIKSWFSWKCVFTSSTKPFCHHCWLIAVCLSYPKETMPLFNFT